MTTETVPTDHTKTSTQKHPEKGTASHKAGHKTAHKPTPKSAHKPHKTVAHTAHVHASKTHAPHDHPAAKHAKSPAHRPHRVVNAHAKRVTVQHSRKAHPEEQSFVRRHWLVGVLSLVLVVIGVMLFRHHQAQVAASKHHSAPPAVPIVTTMAKKGDIGVYLQALGSVLPLATVTLNARVSGEIMKVNYTEGQIVHKNDLLIEIDPRPYQAALKQMEGQMARDLATLNKDRINLKRYRQAFAANAIAKQQLDDQVQTVQQDEGVVKTDQGNLDNAKLNLSYCYITSPIDGRVGLRPIDVGNMVQPSSTVALATITQLQPITVVFSLPEDNLAQVQEQIQQDDPASGSSMQVDAYDRSQEKKIAEGKFLTLDNQIDPTTGTVKLKGIFDNKDNALFPSQFVNVRLLVTTQHNATLILSSTIQRNTKGAYVYVIKQDQTAEMREIKTGTVDGDLTAVTGVQPGEMLATNGFDKLQSGVKVSPQQGKVASPTQAGI